MAASGHAGFSAGLRYMALGAFYFSLMSFFVKLAGRRLPSQEIVLARAVISLLLTIGILKWRGTRPWGSRPGLLALRGLLGFGALSCFYYSIVHLPLADATVIQYTNPVFAALLAAWLLAERIARLHLAMVFVSLTGVALVARPTFLFSADAPRLPPLVVLVALGGALLSASAYVAVRKLREEDTMVIVFWFAAVSVLGSLPALWWGALMPTPREWLVLIAVGVTTQLGQIYLTRGLRREPAGRATAVAYLQVVFAAILGALFFREMPDAWVLTGAALIIGSTLVIGRVRAEVEAEATA